MKKTSKRNTLVLILVLLMIMDVSSRSFAQTWNLNGNAGTDGTNFIGTTDNKAFRIRTNNAVRITLTGNGKLGIGNTAPVFKLDVKNGSINTDSMFRIRGYPVLKSGGSGLVQIGDNIVSVGIGTASPTAALDVFNNANIGISVRSATGNASFNIDRGDVGDKAFIYYRTGGNDMWAVGDSGDVNGGYVIKNIGGAVTGNVITILRSNSNVGIGTGNPQSKLDVAGDVRVSQKVVATGIDVNGTVKFTGAAGTPTNGFVLTANSSGLAEWKPASSGGTITGSGAAKRVAFWSDVSSLSSNSNLFWDSTNLRLGIGTATPAAQLEVNGQIKITGGVPGPGKVLTSDANGLATWQTISGGGVVSGNGAAGRLTFWDGTFTLNSNSILSWDNTNGRLGIGTTAPSARLEVAGQIKITGGSPGAGKFLTSDATGLASWTTGVTGGGINGTIAFWNGTTALNGNSNLYWDNTNGRLGIANSTPNVRLHVAAGTDASLASGTGYMVLGALSGTNVVFDDNEIIARNNGAAATLTINNNGGNVVIDGTNSGSNVGIGLSSPTYRLQLSANSAAKPTSSSWTVASDARLKKNVSDFKEGLDIINKIHPVWFNYNGLAGMPTNERGVGTLAQELQKIAPYMVKEWTYENNHGEKRNFLGVDYGAMDFILVNAIKEQQIQIDSKNELITKQQKDIDDLKTKFALMENALSQCCNTYQQEKNSNPEKDKTELKASLEQNIPNPFSEKTVIRFYIPQRAIQASIKIYALDGSELKSIILSSRGYGEAEISGRTLVAGTYTYMLLVDGQAMDTKQMVLTK